MRQLPDLSSSHIRVFNLPPGNLLQQPRGQACALGQPGSGGWFSPLLGTWCFLRGLERCEEVLN